MARELTERQAEITQDIAELTRWMDVLEAEQDALRTMRAAAIRRAVMEGVPQNLLADRTRTSKGWISRTAHDTDLPAWFEAGPKGEPPLSRLWRDWLAAHDASDGQNLPRSPVVSARDSDGSWDR